MEPGLRLEGGFFGVFFFGAGVWRAVYDSAATGADNDQLWAPLFSLSRTSLAHQKDLTMTRYRCQPHRFSGSPAGQTWHTTRWPATIWDSEVASSGDRKSTACENTSSRNPISLMYTASVSTKWREDENDSFFCCSASRWKLGCGASLNCLSAASLVTQYRSVIAAS